MELEFKIFKSLRNIIYYLALDICTVWKIYEGYDLEDLMLALN